MLRICTDFHIHQFLTILYLHVVLFFLVTNILMRYLMCAVVLMNIVYYHNINRNETLQLMHQL